MYNRPISLVSIIAFSFDHNQLDLSAEALVAVSVVTVTAFVASAFRSRFAVASRRVYAGN